MSGVRMKLEVVVHCGCGADFDLLCDAPFSEEKARLYFDAALDTFWHDHTHNCQDPEELGVEDQIKAVITSTREELNNPHSYRAREVTLLNAIDEISDLVVYKPAAETPITTPQSS